MKHFLKIKTAALIAMAVTDAAEAMTAGQTSTFSATPVVMAYSIGDEQRLTLKLGVGSATAYMQSTTMKSEEKRLRMSVEIQQKINGITYDLPLLMAIEAGNPSVVYYIYPDEQGQYAVTLPGGTYDFVAVMITIDTNTNQAIFAIPQALGVKAEENKSVLLSVADCTIATNWEPRLPDGGEFVAIQDFDNTTGNSGRIATDFCVGQGNALYFIGRLIGYSADIPVITNTTTSNVEIFPVATYIGTYGAAFASAAFRLDGKAHTTGADGWRSTELTFSPTPLNRRITPGSCEEMPEEYILVNQKSFLCGTFFSEGNASMGFEVPQKFMLWGEKDSRVRTFCQPSGMAINSNENFIGAQYYGWADSGLVPIGRNVVDQWDSFSNFPGATDGNIFADGNPRYEGPEYLGVNLGNCTPVMVVIPGLSEMATKVNFGYLGTYGEVITQDTFNIDLMTNPEYRDLWGPQFLEYSVMKDGQEIVSRYAEVYDNTWEKGNYEVNVKMDNVLIDGEVAGYNKATVKFGQDNLRGSLPTVTALQFRDSKDHVTNRFDTSDGAFMEFFGGQMTRLINQIYNVGYYDYSPLKSVKVEYASTGSDEWKELPVEEVEELFCMPGYGMCYRSDLSIVNELSKTGWFDVRVTLDGDNGASQQQVISPAFQIKSLSGIENVVTENDKFPVEYCNLQGVRILNPEPGQIVIVRQGARATKQVMK